MQGEALRTGDSFALISYNRSGEVSNLEPLSTEQMKVTLGANRRLIYEYDDPNNNKKYTWDSKNVFHLKPFSRDGIRGRTPIQVASEVIGQALAIQTHGNAIFENGAFLSGFLKVAHDFKDDEQRKSFVDSFKKLFQGAKNAGKVGLLEGGAEYSPFSMNNRDAQFLEAHQFTVPQICRLFRMPPHMIQSLESGMSFASVEQMSILFVQYTIQPWITRWERAINRQLIGLGADEKHFVKFNISALLRGDLQSRTQAIIDQLQYGLLTINEGRDLLDQNPADNELADEILVSHNLKRLKDIEEAEPVDQEIADPEEPEVEPEEEDPSEEPEEKAEIKKSLSHILEAELSRMLGVEETAIKRAFSKESPVKKSVEFYETFGSKLENALFPILVGFGNLLDIQEDGLKRWVSSVLDSRASLLVDASKLPAEEGRALMLGVNIDTANHLEDLLAYLFGEVEK
jgi:HK97 family phage portal protein